MAAPGYVPNDDEEDLPGQGAMGAPATDTPALDNLDVGGISSQIANVGQPPAAAPPTQSSPPGAPGAPPPAPVAGIDPDAALDPEAEARRLYGQQAQLGDQAVSAEQQAGAARGAIADAKGQNADANAQAAADNEAKLNQALDIANAKTQKWADSQQAAYNEYLQASPHDYWADKSTGNKVLAGLSMMFGAANRPNNSGNAGMNLINNAIDRDFRLQQAKIEKLKGNYEMARQGGESARQDKTDMLADLGLRKAAKYETSAAQLTALLMKQGVPLEQAQTNANVVALRQKAAATQLDTVKQYHAQQVEDAKLGIERQKEADARLRAEAYARKMARGGAGGAANNAGEAQILKAIENGAKGSDVRELAAKLGVKPQRVDALENQGRAAAAAAAKNVSGEDNPLSVRDGSGNVIGLAPNARSVKAIQDRWVQYDNAIEALKQLQKSRADASLPSPGIGDPLYDKAVLAVSAVTQANSSDKTTGHEAGTLKKYGLVNQGSIANVLADMQRRQEQFGKQLRPLPTAGEEKGTPSAASAPRPAPAPVKLTDRDRALKIKARQTINDPKADPKLKASAQTYLDRIGG